MLFCLQDDSIATRIAYALILLINSILSWIMYTPWAMNKLKHLTLNYMKISCDGKECHGFVAVHRINFALGVFHALLAILLLGVKSSKNGRAPIQNGYWAIKIIGWLALIVLTFLIPEGFFIIWGNHFALIGAILFLLLGLILLVDLAHTWAEYCLEKIEFRNSRLWRSVLIGSTLGMYLGSFALTIVMYIFFAHSGCSMNQAAITVSGFGHILYLSVTDVIVGQPHPASSRVIHLRPPNCPGLQSTSWVGSVGYGGNILHLSDHVSGFYGTGRQTMQSIASRYSRNEDSFHRPRGHRDHVDNRLHHNSSSYPRCGVGR